MPEIELDSQVQIADNDLQASCATSISGHGPVNQTSSLSRARSTRP